MKKTLESGAEIDVTLASFAVCTKLLKCVASELGRVELNLMGPDGNLKDLMNLEIGDQLINTSKNVISALMSSDSIEAALWPCLEKATYRSLGGTEQRISRELFDTIEAAREDYIPIAREVLWFNLRPFFKNLSSLWKDIQARVSSTPKSES